MKTCRLRAAAAVLGAIVFSVTLAGTALAQSGGIAGDAREYVGETTVSTFPNLGIIALHDLCDADFPGARICSSSDIISNGGVGAAAPATAAWVNPTLVGGHSTPFALVQSGVPSTVSAGFISCHAWSSTSSVDSGLIFNSDLTIGFARCDHRFPAACCTLAEN